MSNRSILDFFAKKQTDSNSGARRASQTGENAQERINLKSKKKGNNGHDPLKERTNKFVKEKVKEGPSKSHVQQCDEGQSHTFNFRYKFKKHAVACDTSKTVLDALNTNKIFKKIKKENMDKEIVIKRSKGEVPRAAVKTDFPCRLIEKDELLDISFIKNTGNVDTKKKTTGRLSFSNESENLVIFYIKTKGGVKVKRLTKNNELRKKVDDVCVYAFKEDKLKAALQRDGRFINVIFKKQCALREFGSEINHVMSSTVEHLDRKHFEIIVISDKNQPDSQDDFLSDVSPEMNEASAADLKENVDPNQHPVNSEQEETKKGNTMKSTNTSAKYSKVIDSEEILGILRSQYKDLLETLKQRENLKNKSQVQTFFRAEYDKSVQSFSEVYKIKQLMRLSDSVCQIRVEGSARGTGFLLFGQFILTNAHVVREFLESPDKFYSTKSLEAAFDFERLDSKVKLVPFKKQIAAYCYITDTNKSHLDFALLELDAVDEITDRPELLRRFSSGPLPSGGICIVGHPDGGIKKMDPCFIIEKTKLQEAADKHISENINFINVITQRSFEDKWDIYENQINYNSCFFHGSSGSPVFDEDCYLIGVHTGGYVYKGERGKTRSIVEYAYSMQPILDMIRAQARIKGLHEIVNILEAYSDKSYEYETADQENQTDIEMEDCD
ncbi:serine protease FAM111A isoform X6 [Ctenopharyngodon idella]|uniref:serine protease FAM111A isoform X5 n=1 Tax=Ctenopharyngodon idella TaxID=7959 RepID=UPI00222FCB38|nr:serine protease FAM111A isoform X5 [Ctenopharyngodon idella]XP_051751246.1 serine protease FAM111A isoform X6 [Ctenopharyngodon idella]